MTGLKELLEIPPSVGQAAEVVAGLDRCLLLGFGRLGPEQTQALQGLERICAGTPLAPAVSAAVAAIGRNEFVEPHFVSLAAARAAIQGAQYDALRAHALEALGRTPPAPASPDGAAALAGEVPGPVKVWQESTRHWLMELALAGFKQLEHPTLAPFSATLEQIQGEPLLTRLAALLTGFLQELLDALPVASLPSIPIYRWADLWTRAMLASMRPPPGLTGRKVSGTLRVLGVDLRHHGFFASFDAYGLLEEGDKPQLVRTTLSSFKVDVIHGSEMWQCFGRQSLPLLQGISQHVALNVRDMTLLPTGDLLWDGAATPGAAGPFLETAAQWLSPGAQPAPSLPPVAPLDRHPVQLGEPLYLDGYQVQNGDTLQLALADGAVLPVALNRLSSASELKPQHLKESTALLGLLRFDSGSWSVQPLAARFGKGREEYTGSTAYDFVSKQKGETLATLKERASRLLRKKS